VASNGNNHVSLWRNDGSGKFTKTLIYGEANFVLSVTAVDFDRDGDMDVASASFFDGHIRWYENLDGKGNRWANHTVYAVRNAQGHYVSHADMDGDGDDDLIAVTHAENSVAVFPARSDCDAAASRYCCSEGSYWNGTACAMCKAGTYGVKRALVAACVACPKACHIPGRLVVPASCLGETGIGRQGCADEAAAIKRCVCPDNTVLDPKTDVCVACGAHEERKSDAKRGLDSLGNYSLWAETQGVCEFVDSFDYRPIIYCAVVIAVLLLAALALYWRRVRQLANADALWTIKAGEISYDSPPTVLGQGTYGHVVKGYYRGTSVAVKRALPPRKGKGTVDTDVFSSGPSDIDSGNSGLATGTMNGSVAVFVDSVDNSNIVSGPFVHGHRTGVVSVVNSSGEIAPGWLGRVCSSCAPQRSAGRAFIDEMRVLSKLRHPCITTVMGAVLSKEPFLVMECMSNGSLRSLLSNQTFPLDPELSLPLLRDILQGMRFLHAANPPIVHGDLKAANVLVDENFRAKIADFGSTKRKAGVVVGTPFWMAPELLLGGTVSPATDVYAFGVTLWELMTRKIPYDDLSHLSQKEILTRVSKGDLRPNCEVGLDKELVACMHECWAQEASSRATLPDLELRIIPLCGQNFFTVMEQRHVDARRQKTLLHDVFPPHISQALLEGRKVEPEQHECVTIYFSDIVSFTTISSQLSGSEVSMNNRTQSCQCVQT
jgi:serine/threonine protein kinase